MTIDPDVKRFVVYMQAKRIFSERHKRCFWLYKKLS